MPLSRLDLVSSFFGRWSFGFSLWFAIPQIGKLYELKPQQGGPSFILLSMWLIGDIAQTVGVFIIGGLDTQKASMICFAVATSVITLQRLYYRGYVPFNSFWKKRKAQRPVIDELISGVHREPKYIQSSLGRRSSKSTVVEDEEKAPLRAQRLDRRTYIDSSSNETAASGKPRRCLKLSKVWKDFDGWRVNLSGYLLVTIVMISVWVTIDFVPRDEANVNLEVALPPSTQVEKIGWMLGWLGTVLYNAPRVYQLYKTIASRSVSAISAFTFAALVLQNITMLISIVSVSHTRKTVIAQAPYLANLACALSGDVIFLVLYQLYHNNPPPRDKERPWSDPDWMYSRRDESLPPQAATGQAASRQARHQYQHGIYVPPMNPPMPKKPNKKYRPPHPEETRLRRKVEINGINNDRIENVRNKIETMEKESLKAEREWPQQRRFIPWMARGKREKELDDRAEEERRLSRRIQASSAMWSSTEEDEHSEWVEDTAGDREKLRKLRKERSEKAERESRNSRNRMGDSGYVSASPSLSPDTDRCHSGEWLRSTRHRSIGKSRRHPRRGVGTSSEEDVSSE